MALSYLINNKLGSIKVVGSRVAYLGDHSGAVRTGDGNSVTSVLLVSSVVSSLGGHFGLY